MRLPQDIFPHKPSAGSLRQFLFGGVRKPLQLRREGREAHSPLRTN